MQVGEKTIEILDSPPPSPTSVPTTPKPKTPPPIDSLGSTEKQLGPKGRLSFSRVSSLVKRLDFRSFAERDWPKQVGGRYFSHAIRAPYSDEEVHDGLWLNGPYDSEEEEKESEGPLEAPEEFQYPDPEELEQALPCEFQYPDPEELEALLRELPHPDPEELEQALPRELPHPDPEELEQALPRELPHPDPEELEQALPRELPHPDPEELGQAMEEIEKVALEPPVQVEEVKENRDLVPARVEE